MKWAFLIGAPAARPAPAAAGFPCPEVPVPNMPPMFRPFGQASRPVARREADQRRGSARDRGYTTAWDKARAGHLQNSPLCLYCELNDELISADTVDHLYPHRGDQGLFWNRTYWISCCATCHSGFKQAVEREGRAAIDRLARRLGLTPLTACAAPPAVMS